jgi:aspartyl/asparaginyl beta-hydroxylase (cupin superfamily)
MVVVFLDPERFPFLIGLQDAWRDIREECLALPGDTYEPWVQREMYGHGWSVYGLLAFGERIEAALAACPRTAAALAQIPHLTTAGFSRMAPGTHIAPHEGWVTTVYRAHLGLVVPDGCALKVGGEIRRWREGEAFVFDDTVEHSAWNRGKADRIILLFDFSRPGMENAARDRLPPSVQARLRRGAGS